jgi:hypothetical protein
MPYVVRGWCGVSAKSPLSGRWDTSVSTGRIARPGVPEVGTSQPCNFIGHRGHRGRFYVPVNAGLNP